MVREKGKKSILGFQKQTNKHTNKQTPQQPLWGKIYKQTNKHGKAKIFRTQFLLLKKKSRGKEKSKNSILTFQKKKKSQE